jgi:outer membrane protein assembly factor BamB
MTNRIVRTITPTALLFLAHAAACWAQLAPPTITITPTSGPPGTRISVSGSGFAPNTAVDIYFNTKDEALASTNGSGNFRMPIRTPVSGTSAPPGINYITAVDRDGGTSAQVQFLVQTNWPEYGFTPTNTRYNPYENLLNPQRAKKLGLLWSFPTGGPVQSSPAVVNGVVYVGSNANKLYALNASNGSLLWTFTTSGPVVSSPAVVNGQVYFGSQDGNVYAVNDNGAFSWLYTTGGQVNSTPTVANGIVYIGSDDQNVYALSALTGTLVWPSPFPAGYDIRSAPAVAGGVVYVGGSFGPYNNVSFGVNGILYALNGPTGVQLWNDVDIMAPVSSPALANGLVYSADANGGLSAALTSSGQLQWQDGTYAGQVEICVAGEFPNGCVEMSSPAVANGTVYINDADGAFAFDANSGNSLGWQPAFGGYGSCDGDNSSVYPVSAPAIADGVVYAGGNCNGGVRALDTSGNVLWSWATSAGVESSPAVVNGVVFVGCDDGNVYAFGLGGTPAVEPPAPSSLKPDFSLPLSPIGPE